MSAIATLDNWLRNRAFEITAEPRGQVFSLIADTGFSLIGGQACLFGKGILTLTSFSLSMGSGLGAYEGAKEALEEFEVSGEFFTGIKILGISAVSNAVFSHTAGNPIMFVVKTANLASSAVSMSIFTRCFVSLGVHESEGFLRRRAFNENPQRMPSPTAKAAEWAAGAFAGTLVAGAAAGSSGILLSTAAGVLAAKATRAAVRGIQSRWFH